jgi:protein-disulfide isomerase
MIKPALPMLMVLAVAACSRPATPRSAPESSAAPAVANPEAPLARIGGETITAGEVEKTARPQIARMEAEHAEQVHNVRTQTLDGMIDKRLLEAKAKKENITVDQLVQRDITSKVNTPPDPELHAAYDKMKAQGRQLPPFEQIKTELANFLKERSAEEVRKGYMEKLRAEAKVQVMLPPLLLPKVAVAADGPAMGEQKAPVTIVEFSDYQCPFCSRAEETVKKVLDQYKGKVRLVFRDYPLPFHPQAQKASEAAHCAGDQGKYWQMHEKLFANQSALGVPQLKDHAKGLGLDAAKFDKCLDSGEKAKIVETSKKAGDEAGVNGTPAFFINGRPLSGAREFEKFKEIIDYELANGA